MPFPRKDRIEDKNANNYRDHDLFEKIIGRIGDTIPVGFCQRKNYDGYQTVDSSCPYGQYDMVGNILGRTGEKNEGAYYNELRCKPKANDAFILRLWMRNGTKPIYHRLNAMLHYIRKDQEFDPFHSGD